METQTVRQLTNLAVLPKWSMPIVNLMLMFCGKI